MLRLQSYSAGARILAVGIKFSVVLILARSMPAIDYVKFVTLMASVTLGVFIVGLDLWTYVYRRLVNLKESRLGEEVNRDLSALILISFILNAAVYVVWDRVDIDLHFMSVASLVFIELLCFQFARYFQARQEIIWFSVVIAAKTGIWPLITLLLLVLGDNLDFEDIVTVWLSTGIVIAVSSWLVLASKYRLNFKFEFDGIWLKSALRFSLLYWISTMSVKAMTTLDRIAVGQSDDVNSAYVYVLSASVAGVYMLIVDSTVYSRYSPQLVREFESDRNSFISTTKQLLRTSSLLLLLIFILMLPGFYVLDEIVNKPFIIDHSVLFFMVQLGSFILSLSFAFHHVNFGANLHRYNQIAQIIGGLSFVLSLMIIGYDAQDVVASFIYSAALIFLIKLAGVRHAIKCK